MSVDQLDSITPTTECPSLPHHDSISEPMTPNSVELAADALEEQQQTLDSLSKLAFDRLAEYVRGELEITLDDYNLLAEMNKVAAHKYSDMRNVATGVSKTLEDMNEKYRALQPYLDQVDQLEASVTQLEQIAYRLDADSKKLEAKFKSLEKR